VYNENQKPTKEPDSLVPAAPRGLSKGPYEKLRKELVIPAAPRGLSKGPYEKLTKELAKEKESEREPARALASTKTEEEVKAYARVKPSEKKAANLLAGAQRKRKAKAKTEVEANAKAEPKAKGAVEAKVAQKAAQKANEIAKEAKAKVVETKAKAYGDPHMQNVYGERFDLMQPGSHTLVQIPRRPMPGTELFRVQARVQRVGRKCADMYIQTLNVTGGWAEMRQQGGLRYSASDTVDHSRSTGWMRFGNTVGHLDLKVVHGTTSSGIKYLNFFVRHLGESGYRVGGLLGEDDHTDAATPDSNCKTVLMLLEKSWHDDMTRSVAEASLL